MQTAIQETENWIYDPPTDQWHPMATAVSTRCHEFSLTNVMGKVIAIGGTLCNAFLAWLKIV